MQLSATPLPTPVRWQQLWRQAVRDPRVLLQQLGLDPDALPVSAEAARQFAVRVPQGFIARMRHGDRHDPLLRQVLPITDEMQVVPGFSLDAVGDGLAKKATGVIQKYRGRALLVTTGSCAINCRYCFAATSTTAPRTRPRKAGARRWTPSPRTRTSTR